MNNSKETYIPVYINMFFKSNGKINDIRTLTDIFERKLNYRIDEFKANSFDLVEYEIRKNPNYNEESESKGEYIDYYFLSYFDINDKIPWDVAFSIVCRAISELRSLGASVVAGSEYEEDINKKIGYDSFAKP